MAELYFKQLLAGRDIGRGDPIATQMQNFVYLIGDKESGECVVVDPAWAVDDLVDLVEQEDMKLVGALATHYHPDHVGGTMYGLTVEGLPRLMERAPCKVHAHKLEVPGIRKVTGLDESDFVKHDSGDKVKVGDIEIELLHTPGHTPGSLCFRLKSALVAGDTLFLQGCGRVDLPGGDPEEMYHTLTQRLSTLPGDTMLYPGHAYGGEQADMDTVRRTNQYMSIPNLETWMRYMG
jgi:glyoxylase-like metal-dependent hydrolase (beta-lactamase superfamily II)